MGRREGEGWGQESQFSRAGAAGRRVINLSDAATPATEGYYFSVSPLLLFPRSRGGFGVYLKVKDRYLLYAHPDEPFTEDNLQKLHANGVQEVFVLSAQRDLFESYLEENLGEMLMDDSLPLGQRSRVFYNASVGLVRETFQSGLPCPLDAEQYQKMERMVTMGVRFLSRQASLKSVGNLISHHYQTYSHCVHVFVYATTMMQTLGLPEETVVQYGLGAMLHDLGKTMIDKNILDKPGPLTPQERQEIQTHPVRGAGLCALAPLSQEAINGILFHHEWVDGSGYPGGLKGEFLPMPVKVIAVADVYDALISARAYAAGRTPFQALSVMREELGSHLDPEAFRLLVLVLSGAQIV